jgi:hypothetical protein
MSTFFRVLNASPDKKACALLVAIHSGQAGRDAFVVDPRSFGEINGSPFAYWLNDSIRSLFSSLPRFELDLQREVRLGASTKYDARFVRLWFEPNTVDAVQWSTYANGGKFGKFFQDYATIVRSGSSFKELGAYLIHKFPYLNGDPNWILHSENDYSQPAIGWPLRTHAFSPHALPAKTVFSARTYAAYIYNEDRKAVAALLASRPVDFLLKVMLGRSEHPEFVTGVVRALPWTNSHIPERLSELFTLGWRTSRRNATADETSRHFILPKLLLDRITPDVEVDLSVLQNEIDEIAFQLYGMGPKDRSSIERFGNATEGADAEEEPLDAVDNAEEVSQEEDAVSSPDDRVLSWAMGVAFGRFDIRLATGDRPIPPEPDPFHELPSCSPAMLLDDQARSAMRERILADDPGIHDDVVANIAAIYDRLKLSVPDADVLRRKIARDLFAVHVKMYSKSRRKSPIYWQISTPSAQYSVWVYTLGFTKDTLMRVQNDFVAPKLLREQRQLDGLRSEAAANPTGAQSKQIEAQEAFVVELKNLLEEMRRVTALWDPKLDDGVIVNAAPFWRLFPQNRNWQRDLKSTWEGLCRGDFDWSHLAMRFWPERVIPKCTVDHSLAIAHDLEDIFWFEHENGKWKQYDKPMQSIDDAIRERSSPAVKSALRALIEARDTVSGTKRGRKAKAA